MKKIFLLIILFLFSLSSFSQQKLIPSKSGGLYGFKQGYGQDAPMLIDFKYEDAGYFNEGKAAVKLNGKWGYINVKGRTVLGFNYEQAHSFQDKYAAVQQNGQWLLIDSIGKPNLKVRGYQALRASYPYNETYYAKKDQTWGLINTEGKVLIDFKYDQIYPWAKDKEAYLVFQNGKVGLAKTDGSFIFPPIYEYQNRQDFRFDGDIVYFERAKQLALFDGKKWGVLSVEKGIVIPFEYDEIQLLADRKDYGKFKIALLKKGTQSRVIDQNGQELFSGKVNKIYDYYKKTDYVLMEREGQKAFYNLAKAAWIEGIGSVGFDIFEEDGFRGVVDNMGKTLIPFEYEYIQELDYSQRQLTGKYFKVNKGRLSGVFQVSKGLVILPQYAGVHHLPAYGKSFFALKNTQGKWALANDQGRMLSKFIYDALSLSEGKIKGSQNAQKVTLDAEGKSIE